MLIRTVLQKKRRCSSSGKRKEGAAYLVSELDENGVLPPIVEIVPPLAFEPPPDKPLGRIPIMIDGDLLLQGASYEEYIAGSSAIRLQRERQGAQEEFLFGMPLGTRVNLGMCRDMGLEALSQVRPNSLSQLGRCYRHLARVSPDVGVARAGRAFQEKQWKIMLAALHWTWRRWPAQKKANPQLKAAIKMTMICLNALEDAQALQ